MPRVDTSAAVIALAILGGDKDSGRTTVQKGTNPTLVAVTPSPCWTQPVLAPTANQQIIFTATVETMTQAIKRLPLGVEDREPWKPVPVTVREDQGQITHRPSSSEGGEKDRRTTMPRGCEQQWRDWRASCTFLRAAWVRVEERGTGSTGSAWAGDTEGCRSGLGLRRRLALSGCQVGVHQPLLSTIVVF